MHNKSVVPSEIIIFKQIGMRRTARTTLYIGVLTF
jgi:hypothetical protein